MVFQEFPPSVASATPLTIQQYSDRNDQQAQFLRFRLFPETTLLLPVSQLTEVLTVPISQIIPIPEMPPWVMGVYNWRGEILWMIDLGALLGLTPWHQQTQVAPAHRAIVLQSIAPSTASTKGHRHRLGMVVSQVEEIEWCDPREIQIPPDAAVTPSLAPFFRGYWLTPQTDMLVVLDGEAILAAMPTV